LRISIRQTSPARRDATAAIQRAAVSAVNRKAKRDSALAQPRDPLLPQPLLSIEPVPQTDAALKKDKSGDRFEPYSNAICRRSDKRASPASIPALDIPPSISPGRRLLRKPGRGAIFSALIRWRVRA
jgi:hypothetical protein